ncbi:MAG: amidohydrolase family protein [Candidatus Thorarchaeota archaeon]
MEKERIKIEMHNCHAHTFLYDDVPTNFLPLGLVRFLARRSVRIARFLNNLIPGTDGDLYDRFANFLRLMKCPSQEMILKYLMQFYPKNTKFIILAMDMEFMGAGKISRPYVKQLNELSTLKKKYPENVYPFIGIDPRRNNITDLVKEYVENHQFCGLKLYPPLGYFPYDDRLTPIYKYAEQKGLPVIAHSSKSGPIYCRSKKKVIMQTITAGIDPATGLKVDFRKKDKKELCNYFTHPLNYKILLEKFPKLKICLAHFGGGSQWHSFLNPSTLGLCEQQPLQANTEESWFSIIYDLMKTHKTLFSDISFTLEERDYFATLKVILTNPQVREQILFGSDFYMVEVETSERAFGIDLHGFLGTEDFRQIVETNPKIFLSSCLKK